MIKLRRLFTATAGLSALAISCSSPGGDNSGGEGGANNAKGGTTSANGGTTSNGGTPANGGSPSGGSPGNGGAANGGASSGGAANGGTTNGGSSNGGSSNGGSSKGGSPNGGSTNGGSSNGGSNSGGASAGGKASGGGKNEGGSSNGGSANMGGNTSSGGQGGGSGSATFSQVATLLSMKCGGSMCHAGSNHLNLANMSGLYMRLTTPIPMNNSHCGGTTLVMPGDAANSFLAKVIQGSATCTKGSGTEEIDRMPFMCSTSSSTPRACLTANEIKVITDWITAGAPQ
ncbi:MAG: hypothetical protein ACOY0T_14945 [Myxococcota bacterium]